MKTFLYTLKLDDNRDVCLVKEKELVYSQKLVGPKAVADMLDCCFDVRHEAQECVYLVCTKSDTSISGIFIVSKGTMDSAQVSVREVLSRVLLTGSTSFIIAHNHPAGSVDPSKDDIKVANDLFTASKIMDVTMNDFIIIGDGCNSFRENKISPF